MSPQLSTSRPTLSRSGPGWPRRPARLSWGPLVPSRYQVRFTASAELRDKLERLRALMRPSVPDADLARIIDTAVTEVLAEQDCGEDVMARFRAATSHTSVAVDACGARIAVRPPCVFSG